MVCFLYDGRYLVRAQASECLFFSLSCTSPLLCLLSVPVLSFLGKGFSHEMHPQLFQSNSTPFPLCLSTVSFLCLFRIQSTTSFLSNEGIKCTYHSELSLLAPVVRRVLREGSSAQGLVVWRLSHDFSGIRFIYVARVLLLSKTGKIFGKSVIMVDSDNCPQQGRPE